MTNQHDNAKKLHTVNHRDSPSPPRRCATDGGMRSHKTCPAERGLFPEWKFSLVLEAGGSSGLAKPLPGARVYSADLLHG